MSLLEQVSQARISAMKSKDAESLSTLRILWSALQNKKIELGKELTDDDIITVISTQVKQLKESISEFEAAGRSELTERANAEIKVLMPFMPEQLSDEQIAAEVDKVVAELGDGANMGAVMGKVMSAVKGKADGGKVREIVSQKLS